ncbi:MAG: hypothetical protein PVH07_00830 [Chloroflexota bacterium]|jgi:hypothetical protein
MATRLEITHGLIAEPDRLSTSADTLSVTRPSTGSETRSKGVLFVVVGSSVPGPRAREATALVAETIRHEYYYDESAGVPVCLEKAVRSADRRLRSSREGAGLPPGSLGVAAAVIRNNELYLATLGPAEAYLVRSARLLMPDRSAPAGLPSDDGRAVDVWRGELHVGDGLLLVSRNLTEMVGTEELKSAILTLHPQAAVEHLHHLFVAAGGAGSDGIIAVEATEQTSRLPLRATAPAGGAYGNHASPIAEPVGGTVASAVLGVRDGFDGIRDHFLNAMPRRRATTTGLSATESRAETQRRAAMGLLALVVVVLVAGLVLALVPRGTDVTEVAQVAGSDTALSVAKDATDRADNLLASEPATATEYYREAWAEIERARATGLSASALDELEARVGSGLDTLYDAKATKVERVTRLPDGQDPAYLVQGPRGGAIYIDRADGVVYRANLKNGKIADIIHEGDNASGGKTIGRPVQLTVADYVIAVDDKARPFRWGPSNSAGAGTLAKINLRGRSAFERNHGDVEAYDPPVGQYRMYVAEPSLNQIMRYTQTFDGSAFDEPTAYLASQTSEVNRFDQLYIDYDVYALFDNTLRRHRFGKYDGTFALGELPDDADLRPGHDYRLVDGSGSATSMGRVYLYDARHGRVVGFSKEDGRYLAQWAPRGEGGEMDDVRGMYVIEGGLNKKGTKRKNDVLVWITPSGIYRTTLVMG